MEFWMTTHAETQTGTQNTDSLMSYPFHPETVVRQHK